MAFLIEYLPVIMFVCAVPLLFTGYPVAFILGGVGFAFWLLAVFLGLENPNSFFLVISRIYGGVVSKLVLVAIPMFIFMGAMLEKTGISRELLTLLQRLTHRAPGGLALSVTLLGVILAATTGIIGASVVMMTLMALPVMLEKGYDPRLATGTIAASGTLGILLPPSIMLVVMADLLATSAGGLFKAAVFPSLMLAAGYMVYILLKSTFTPAAAYQIPSHPSKSLTESNMPAPAAQEGPLSFSLILSTLIPPVVLISLVLGSIFGGYATPTEASGIGAAGSLLLAAVKRKLTRATLKDSLESSTLTAAMIFTLFLGATAFSYVFALLGGHDLILDFIQVTEAGPWAVILTLMLVVFFLGFFFDWIEITLIILPVFAPVIAHLDLGTHLPSPDYTTTWFAIIMAVNLQTSFLTPPFGFALFYLKGAAPQGVTLAHIYRGIIPFVIIQLLGLTAIILWPEIALFLPQALQ